MLVRSAITLGIDPHSSLSFFSSPNLSGLRLDVYHTSTHGVEKIAKNAPSGHHRTTCRTMSSQLRNVSTIGKKVLNSNTSPTCPDNKVYFGPLAAEICWRVWGTPVNFNGFRVSVALLYGILVVGVSKLCGVEQRAPPIFGRAAIAQLRWALAHISSYGRPM